MNYYSYIMSCGVNGTNYNIIIIIIIIIFGGKAMKIKNTETM